MKISNNLITSIACFRKHFEFHSVWGQLDIFLRDMSPKDIPYPDAESELLYAIIKDPSVVNIADEHITIEDTNIDCPFVINNYASFFLPSLCNKSHYDRIRIVALFELAGVEMTNEAISEEVSSADGAKELILSNGQSLKVVELNESGINLNLKLVKVSPQSLYSSIVDGIELQPGKFAYGIFSNQGLHKLLNPVAANNTYSLRLSINESGDVMTKVFHNKYEIESDLLNVVSFCTIGQDDFAYIENNRVYCHHSATLSKRLNDAIDFLEYPLFVQADDNEVRITMNDGSVKYINL